MPAGNTYTAIATQTLGSAAASVTFSSIPSTYTDLVIVCNIIRTTGSDVEFQLNSDTGSNYSFTYLFGDGSSTGSGRASSQTKGNLGYSSSTNPMTLIIQAQNYSNTTTNKTLLARSSAASSTVSAIVNLYRSTSAISSIVLTPNAGNFNTNSVFSIYGIKAA
jgi:hypothetical protein